MADKAEGRVLLPKTVVAKKYQVTLTPNLQGDFKYDGEVTVHLALAEARSEITLHSKEIEVTSCSVVDDAGQIASEIKYDTKLMTVTFCFADPIPAGDRAIKVVFQGLHNNQMNGFYRFNYRNAEGESIIGGSTQFESIDARKCFPCIDEPAQKATFEATLIVDQKLTALSNMPERRSTLLKGGKKKVEFFETPRMSTYLLAFCVGEFEHSQSVTEHGVLVRVYTPPGKCHLGNFSLEVCKKSLDLYDGMFGQPYPLPKLDMIAVPEFAMGAMENWGLVTYRDIDVLIDDVRASSQQKQRVCTVVAHELAHQWFGNLVTMAWWDDLWLNEGFASWMQTYCTDAIFPEWSMWEQFITNEQAGALRLDSLASSHPIQVPIHHAEEVEEVFDGISYFKGACVVRMLHAFLGHDNFVNGLKAYMEKHKYSNTETYDLWNAWESASGKPVAKIMKSWTEQMGFPVVTVKSSTWSSGKLTLELEQEWFLADGSSPSEAKDKLWNIPILVSVGTGNQASVLVSADVMDQRSQKIEVQLPDGFTTGSDTWFKLNGEQHIPMRVLYSETQIESLTKAISTKTMNAIDRAGLIQDSYALAKAGKMDVGSLVKLMESYNTEDSLPVWDGLQGAMVALDRLLLNEPALQARFQAFAKGLVQPCATKLGWESVESDGHLDKMLRAKMIELQERFMADDPMVLATAQERFDKYVADPKAEEMITVLPSEFRQSVFRIVLGNDKDHEKSFQLMMKLIDGADTSAEEKDMYMSIGAIGSIDAKRKVLDWTTSGKVKIQDFFYPILSVSSSSGEALELCWAYLKENFDRIHGLVASASASLTATVVTVCTNGFASQERAQEIEDFFKTKDVPLVSRKVAQVVENVRSNAAFLDKIKESKLLDQVLPQSSKM